MWQLGWEGSLQENGYMYIYGWVLLLSTWNYQNIVNWVCSNIKKKFKKINDDGSQIYFSISSILIYFIGTIFDGVPLSGVLYSYSWIFSILRLSSLGRRYKAFSTCGSHLSVVCFFYGTGIGVYISSALSSSPRKSVVASVMYTVVIPMLNPFIYSLRNKDIKSALWRISHRISKPNFKSCAILLFDS